MKFLKPQDVGKCERFLMLPFDIFESDLPPKAKLLYAYLLNLGSLSVKNDLHDEKGVYVFCTIQKAADILDCNRDTARKVFRILEENKLIYRRFRNGEAFQIYLASSSNESTRPEISTPEKVSAPLENPTPPAEIFDPSQRKNSITPAENFAPNYTEPNYTDSIHTEEKESASLFFPSDEYVLSMNSEDRVLWTSALIQIRYPYRLFTLKENRNELRREGWQVFLKLKEEKQV